MVMRKKKYCFFSSMPRKEREVIMYRQTQSLIEDGFDVYNVVSDNKPVEIIKGCNIIPSGYRARNLFQRIFVSPHKLYKKLLQIDADIYHTVHVDQLLLCLLLKLKGKNVIVELQEDHPYSLFWKFKAPKWIISILVYFMRLWMTFVLKKVDAILTVTPDIVSYLEEWGISKEKIHLQGNFPIVNKDYNLTLEDYLSRDNRILYFGLIYSYSKQEVFLEALSGMKNIKYLVAGKFMSNELNSYMPYITNLPEWKNVEFINGFKHEELKEFINKSTISNVLRDFSVYPREKKGSLGIIKIFESMEAALPIICSDMPTYREIMSKYKCGILVDPLNPDQIKEAIEYLVTHKEEAWEMGQRGRQAVIEEYSWDALSIKYINLVNSLLN